MHDVEKCRVHGLNGRPTVTIAAARSTQATRKFDWNSLDFNCAKHSSHFLYMLQLEHYNFPLAEYRFYFIQLRNLDKALILLISVVRSYVIWKRLLFQCLINCRLPFSHLLVIVRMNVRSPDKHLSSSCFFPCPNNSVNTYRNAMCRQNCWHITQNMAHLKGGQCINIKWKCCLNNNLIQPARIF